MPESKNNIKCDDTRYGCCPDYKTPRNDVLGNNCMTNTISSCNQTRYGCCPDSITPKYDEEGSNCYNKQIGGCRGTRYGCCPDSLTPKYDEIGNNCSMNPISLIEPNKSLDVIGVCSETKFGCCPYSDIPKSNLVGSNCAVSPIIDNNCNNSTYGCCPDNITAKTNLHGSNCVVSPIIDNNCKNSTFGCCSDNITAKINSSGSNCKINIDDITQIFVNPKIILIFVIILIICIVYLILTTNQNGNNGETYQNNPAILFLTILLIIQCSIVGLYYFYNINIYLKIKELFIKTPPPIPTFSPAELPPLLDKQSKIIPEITISPQVYNIPQNIYSYTDAKALCQAYGSRLANYEEVEDSYKKGGEWCNYGWSNGQMILFPTQQKTYDELQKIEGHEHDCGRTGVNGGYIEDANKKFGVNCYGYKPKITSLEQELMMNTTPYPLSEKDILFEQQVDYWKKQIKNILVSPFNYNTWSRL